MQLLLMKKSQKNHGFRLKFAAILLYVLFFLLCSVTAANEDYCKEKRGLISSVTSTLDDKLDKVLDDDGGDSYDEDSEEGQDGNTDGSSSPGNKRVFELNIGLSMINSDCSNTSYPALVVNNQHPAPTIYAVKNDIIQVKVKNTATNTNQSSSIHFHGIRQYGTTFSDGVATITQLAIKQGSEYIQEFQILNQSGTFYYHAHVGTQDDSIQGPLIIFETNEALLAATSSQQQQQQQEDVVMIKDSGYTYHKELVLQWSEYWHQSFYDRYDFYMGSKFTLDGGPDSILLNGRSVYNSSNTSISSDCKGFTVFDVEPNKIYRLRMIGSLTFRVLAIIIPDHNMTLIEIDGEYVEPYDLEYLEIAAGQRMSVLIKTGNYTAGTLFPIASNFRYRLNVGGDGYTNNGYGYLRYGSPSSSSSSASTTAPSIVLEKPLLSSLPTNVFPLTDALGAGWVLKNVKPLNRVEKDVTLLNAAPTRTIKFFMEQIKNSDNITQFINNGRVHIPWGNSTHSLLDQLLSGSLGPATPLDPLDGFSVSHQTYPIGYGEIVDLVFQNVINPGKVCVAHPWHTHGHSHYLIAEGPGDYVHSRDKDIRTFSNPLLKDVSMVYPVIVNGTANGGCGWTKVRIYTDNPGIWAVHCHITSHMLQGKMVILEVATDKIEATRRTF